MGPLNGRNKEKVKYFALKEYIQNIKLEDLTKYVLEDVTNEYEEYMKDLMQYDDLAIILFLCDRFNKEYTSTNELEEKDYPKKLKLPINKNTMFFDRTSIDNKRIKELHKFVAVGVDNHEYRDRGIFVGQTIRIDEDLPLDIDNYEVGTIDGKKYIKDIFWHGVEPEDINNFMKDFIEYYNNDEINKDNLFSLYSNPFLKSALAHLIFVRIHPFCDGNGRTARMIHNIKFTDALNKLKGTKLKISPINISPSILNAKDGYNKRIDNIYFDLEHESLNQKEINQWFNFMLTLIEEEIAYSRHKLNEYRIAMENIEIMKTKDDYKIFDQEVKKMNLEMLRK